MSKYYQDFVGLNTFIYEPTGWDPENQNAVYTALSHEGRETKLTNIGLVNLQVYLNHFGIDLAFGNNSDILPAFTGVIFKNFRFSHQLPTTASFFPALMLHRNGPYGYPMWKQIRVSENPLTRKQNKNNILTIVEEPGPEFSFRRNNNTIVQRAKYGSILKFTETPLVSKFDPVRINGAGPVTVQVPGSGPYGAYGQTQYESIQRIVLAASLGNYVCQFNNAGLNQNLNLQEVSPFPYGRLKQLYMNNGLFDSSSPLSIFETAEYSETVYPPLLYTYRNIIRQRTTFYFPWRDSRNNRTPEAAVDDGFGNSVSQSFWPMDAYSKFGIDPRFVSVHGVDGDKFYGRDQNVNANLKNFTDMGVLQNQYSFAHSSLPLVVAVGTLDDDLRPAPVYNRKHFLSPLASVANFNGMKIEGVNHGTLFKGGANIHKTGLPGGEAKWEAGVQSGKNPFYDTYDDYIQGARQAGKEYSIVPEFKISDHVAYYEDHSLLDEKLDIFEITGGLKNTTGSNQTDFYKIYSNSDFLKHFTMVREDHSQFGVPINIKLKCSAIKKLLPYEGFYPQQRTVQILKQFYQDFSGSVLLSSSVSSYQGTPAKIGFQNILSPIGAPGTLFNSIKSGVAVDYPVVDKKLAESGSSNSRVFMENQSGLDGDYYLSFSGSLASGIDGYDMTKNDGIIFPKAARIPFEALVEMDEFINRELFCNEPHILANHSSSATNVSAMASRNYMLMMNNFLGETPRFFLRGQQHTTFISKPSNEIQDFQKGKNYYMRVAMFKTTDSSQPTFISGGVGTGSFVAPQYSTSSVENFTMYSRPTAFGPPSLLPWNGKIKYSSGGIVNFGGFGNRIGNRSDLGENYPFTAPYYHGQAWADIKFTPTEDRAYNIKEIISRATASYYRYVDPNTDTGEDIFKYDGTKHLSPAYAQNKIYNENAMQLDSSVNLYKILRSEEGPLSEETARWVIQTKWECPTLDFSKLSSTSSVTIPTIASESVPRGMWHQYGRQPFGPRGVYMKVGNIDNLWMEHILGKNPSESLSLADHIGIKSEATRIGAMADGKEISEAVVAVPFIEEEGLRKFFHIDREDIHNALIGQTGLVGESIVEMVRKMRKYVFPPSMDFTAMQEIEPFAMYIFEFNHTLSRQDLADIWQGLYPKATEKFETAESSISHKLLAKELLGGGAIVTQHPNGFTVDEGAMGNQFNDKMRWMVFKVKKRANTSYHTNLVGDTSGGPGASAGGGMIAMTNNDYSSRQDPIMDLNPLEQQLEANNRWKTVPYFSYNWPYDYFSLVELAKIDAQISIGETSDVSNTEVVVPQGNTGLTGTATTNAGFVNQPSGGGYSPGAGSMGTNQGGVGSPGIYNPNLTYTCQQLIILVNSGIQLSASHQAQYDDCIANLGS